MHRVPPQEAEGMHHRQLSQLSNQQTHRLMAVRPTIALQQLHSSKQAVALPVRERICQETTAAGGEYKWERIV